MTQYSDKVEEVRLKQEANEWGESIKYLHFNNGIEEIHYNNGDQHFHDVIVGKKWTVYAQEPINLINKFLRWKATNGER